MTQPVVFELVPAQIIGDLNEVERKHAPAKLYCVGDRRLLQRAPRVSVVGSRKASDDGLRRARKLARLLVERGAIVVSGMAEGIDTAAHRATVDADGSTIAVLGTPLDAPYPQSNLELFELISADHLAVSQFPSGTATQPKNFPIRNRTMALLSHATVIVEAAEKSGSLHQAWEALRLGRPLFFAESMAKDGRLTWPAELRRYGAEILNEETLDELFERLPVGDHEIEFAL